MSTTILKTTTTTDRKLKVVTVNATAYLEIQDGMDIMNINVPLDELRAALGEES